MDESERVSALIGDIYDTALEPVHWPEVLTQLADFIGGSAAAIFWKDAASKSGTVSYGIGIEPHYIRLYFEKYIKLDPATTGHFFAEIGEPMSTADLIPYDEFLETRFYQEWAIPQGLVDFVSCVLDKSVTGAALFGVFRHQRDGVVDEETRRRMRLIVPHVRRAVLIGRVIDAARVETASLTDALDGLAAGMFLVTAGGIIVHANAAGHIMLGKGDPLRIAGGRLAACEPQADQSLGAVFLSAGTGDAVVGKQVIALPLIAADGQRYVAHVLPLTSGRRRKTGAAYAAVAALFVHRAALETPSPPGIIAKAFRLTPTELRVLLAVVQVGGVPEVAEALGVAETTVKTHLARVFDKTGVHRQADLVKLVAGFASPLLG